jgi:phosphatidylglycerol:prolipoprotein diacylglycerol transferase
MIATLPVIAFPAIDPVLIQLGPLAIRWYALAYIGGILLGWWLLTRGVDREPNGPVTRQQLDDFVLWATLGVVLGGRLGYVLFYRPDYYAAHPGEILQMWNGGMSFHGGMLGVVIALFVFSWWRGIPQFALHDRVAGIVPIGLGLGRLANFINGELWGRVSDLPWAMVFPAGGPEPRHPSQLYQALLEGPALFLALWLLRRRYAGRFGPGFLSGAFLIGYAVARSLGELFRQPDSFLGFLVAGTTMGQWLSLPMALVGAALIWRARRPAAMA